MEKETFRFHVQNLSFGWCRVLMFINDKEIYFNADYTGRNPLESFISACAEFLVEDGNAHITWQAQFIQLKITLALDKNKMLHFDIIEQHEHEDVVYNQWNEVIPFDDFRKAIVEEGFRVLNAFGTYGYYRSWQNHEEFPLAQFLCIANGSKAIWKGDSCTSNFSKEIECLQNNIQMVERVKKRKIDKCTVFYEFWQLQCCGEPFAVGDEVKWTCHMPDDYKDAHGIIVDLEEDHHGFATHCVTGTVENIIEEHSDFPEGKKEIWYHRAKTIQKATHSVVKMSNDYNEDETTFWGYIVTLKDVIIKPLRK